MIEKKKADLYLPIEPVIRTTSTGWVEMRVDSGLYGDGVMASWDADLRDYSYCMSIADQVNKGVEAPVGAGKCGVEVFLTDMEEFFADNPDVVVSELAFR